MGKIGRLFVWVIILGGLVYGVYWLYGNWWQTGAAQKTLSNAGEFLNQKTGTLTQSAVNTLTQKASDALKSGAAGLLQVAGQGLANLANNITGSPAAGPAQTLIEAGSGFLPMATGSAFAVPPPAATIIARTNTPLVFAINSGSAYKVDWGDGITGGGELAAQKTQLLSHAWSKEGDYAVRLDVIDSGADNYISFPVRVYGSLP